MQAKEATGIVFIASWDGNSKCIQCDVTFFVVKTSGMCK